MPEQIFLYGVYGFMCARSNFRARAWDAEYEIRHNDKAVQAWTTVGGDEGLTDRAEAIELAYQRGVADIEAGTGIPKPPTLP